MAYRSRLILFIFALVLASLALSLCKGSTPVSVYQLLFADNKQIHMIFYDLRLPRTFTAFVTGGLLGLSGALMQLLLQNPLADPYVLGVSGGAAFFTLLGMLLGLGEAALIGSAWCGSLITIAVIALFSRKHHWQPQALLLCGIALACAFSAGITFILLISPDNHLHSMLFWLTGDLTAPHFPWFALAILAVGMLVAALLAPGCNVLLRGEQESHTLGLAAKPYRIILYFLSALLTATAVTLGGAIGFIGLIMPHFARRLGGYDQRVVMPLSMLLGATLLTFADTLSRTLFAPIQLPVGMMTTLLGVPVFIWLLQR